MAVVRTAFAQASLKIPQYLGLQEQRDRNRSNTNNNNEPPRNNVLFTNNQENYQATFSAVLFSSFEQCGKQVKAAAAAGELASVCK